MNRTATIKIAHIADCHLRASQYGRKSRSDDFLRGLTNAIIEASKAGAEMILCAGDLLDTRNPGTKVCLAQLDTVHALLQKLRLPMLVISGNHDNCVPSWHSRFTALPDCILSAVPSGYYTMDVGEHVRHRFSGIICADNTHISVTKTTQIDDADSEVVQAEVSPDALRILGLPYMEAAVLRERLTELESLSDKPDIIMWHGEVKEFCGYPRENAIEIKDFDSTGAALIALGDQHIHSLKQGKNCILAYPGSTELCSSSEDTNKALYLYTMQLSTEERPKVVSIESIPFATRKVQKFELNTEEDLEMAEKAIEKGSLVFVKYKRTLKNVNARLKAAVASDEENTIIRATPFGEIENMTTANYAPGDKVIKPWEFVHEESRSLFQEEERTRIEEICSNILNPELDHRAIIDRYCYDRLNKVVL